MIPLRPALPADTAAVAAFHHRIWHQTYRDMAPPEARAQLDLDWRLAQWSGWLTRPAPFATLLAERDGAIAGLVSFGPTDHPAFAGRGEIGHLYVDAEQRGRGLGRQLLTQAIAQLRAAGFGGVGLAVVRDNHAARAFYAAAGGQEAGGFTDPGPLWRSDNLLVVWD